MEELDRPLFFAAKPGLEASLASEAAKLGFKNLQKVAGGVESSGGWPEVMKANLWLRGAERVLWRKAAFRAMHLAQLDKRARKVPWNDILPAQVPVSVEAVTRKSKIYHQGAARQRVARAIEETSRISVAESAPTKVMVRIEDDLCVISLDTSGEPLHRRGHKQGVGKAPMRETMAALFLAECGYTGKEPVIDPMCGSGTFIIEAAEIDAGLAPGRSRSFAFEGFPDFKSSDWSDLKSQLSSKTGDARFFGSDRDSGVISLAVANAERAGVSDLARFEYRALSDVIAPEGETGLLIVNPPYGGRIGNKKLLFGLYAKLGEVARERFRGWRIGIVTSDDQLARATGLNLVPGPHVAHGGLKVRLWQAKL